MHLLSMFHFFIFRSPQFIKKEWIQRHGNLCNRCDRMSFEVTNDILSALVISHFTFCIPHFHILSTPLSWLPAGFLLARCKISISYILSVMNNN